MNYKVKLLQTVKAPFMKGKQFGTSIAASTRDPQVSMVTSEYGIVVSYQGNETLVPWPNVVMADGLEALDGKSDPKALANPKGK